MTKLQWPAAPPLLGFDECIKVTSGAALKSTSARPKSAGVSSLGYPSAVDRCDSMDFEALSKSKQQASASKSPQPNMPKKIDIALSINPDGSEGNDRNRSVRQRPWSANHVDRFSRSRPQAWGCLIQDNPDRVNDSIAEESDFGNNFGQGSLKSRDEYSPPKSPERAWQQRLVFPSERPRSAQPLRVSLSPEYKSNLPQRVQKGSNLANFNVRGRSSIDPWIASSHDGSTHTLRLVDILMQMRQQASGRSVQVIDFMRPFDKLRHGFITFAEFRRSMDLCGCFQLAEDEHRLVQEAFAQISGTAGCPTARINYFAFCELLQPKTSSFTSFSVEHRRLLDLLAKAEAGRSRGPRGGAPCTRLSFEAAQRTLRALRGVARRLQACRRPVGDVLAGYDPLRRGFVSQAQMAEVLGALRIHQNTPPHTPEYTPPLYTKSPPYTPRAHRIHFEPPVSCIH
jgi:hypothetical protein